jgi:HAD superfamily hydrolase (TIGR01509 family)
MTPPFGLVATGPGILPEIRARAGAGLDQMGAEAMNAKPEVEAVIFDLDGVLIRSERIWTAVREAYVRKHGGCWTDDAERRMMGMSSLEWSAFIHDELGVAVPAEEISAAVVERMAAIYRRELPLIEGATEAVRRLAAAWTLGLASSANRPLIELVLELVGLADSFAAVVSSEEVARGKPAPDVYLEAAARLGVRPEMAVVVEDSMNGILAGSAAGMAVIAIPDPNHPPDPEALAASSLVLAEIGALTVDAVRAAAAHR